MKIKGSAIFFEHPVASNQMLIKSNFAPLGNPVEAPVKKKKTCVDASSSWHK